MQPLISKLTRSDVSAFEAFELHQQLTELILSSNEEPRQSRLEQCVEAMIPIQPRSYWLIQALFYAVKQSHISTSAAMISRLFQQRDQMVHDISVRMAYWRLVVHLVKHHSEPWDSEFVRLMVAQAMDQLRHESHPYVQRKLYELMSQFDDELGAHVDDLVEMARMQLTSMKEDLDSSDPFIASSPDAVISPSLITALMAMKSSTVKTLFMTELERAMDGIVSQCSSDDRDLVRLLLCFVQLSDAFACPPAPFLSFLRVMSSSSVDISVEFLISSETMDMSGRFQGGFLLALIKYVKLIRANASTLDDEDIDIVCMYAEELYQRLGALSKSDLLFDATPLLRLLNSARVELVKVQSERE